MKQFSNIMLLCRSPPASEEWCPSALRENVCFTLPGELKNGFLNAANVAIGFMTNAVQARYQGIRVALIPPVDHARLEYIDLQLVAMLVTMRVHACVE